MHESFYTKSLMSDDASSLIIKPFQDSFFLSASLFINSRKKRHIYRNDISPAQKQHNTKKNRRFLYMRFY